MSLEVKEELRCTWLPNCNYARDNPCKGATVRLKDVNQEVVMDGNNVPVRKQTMVMRAGPRMVHNEMIKPVDQGGFAGAIDSEGKVVICLSTLRKIWPNWLVPMTKRLKAMCVCDKCGVTCEVQESYNLRRGKIIKSIQLQVDSMHESARTDDFKRHIKRYTDEITENGVLKKKRASQFVDAITCPPLTINGVELHRFACAIGDCEQCKNKYNPIVYEAGCGDNIRYCLYTPTHQCNWHGDKSVVPSDGRPKYRCIECDNLSDYEKGELQKIKKPQKIFSKKYKSVHH